MVSDLKERADELLHTQCLGPAIPQNHAIWSIFPTCPLFQLEPNMVNEEVVKIRSCVSQMIIIFATTHTLINITNLSLDTDDTLERVQLIHDLKGRCLGQPEIHGSLPAAIGLLFYWHELLCIFLLSREESTLQCCKRGLQDLVAQCEATPQYYHPEMPRYVKHDLESITDIIDREEVSFETIFHKVLLIRPIVALSLLGLRG